jgi:hypothetical protein
MCKKVAQLTRVIYFLNMKNEDLDDASANFVHELSQAKESVRMEVRRELEDPCQARANQDQGL